MFANSCYNFSSTPIWLSTVWLFVRAKMVACIRAHNKHVYNFATFDKAHRSFRLWRINTRAHASDIFAATIAIFSLLILVSFLSEWLFCQLAAHSSRLPVDEIATWTNLFKGYQYSGVGPIENVATLASTMSIWEKTHHVLTDSEIKGLAIIVAGSSYRLTMMGKWCWCGADWFSFVVIRLHNSY